MSRGKREEKETRSPIHVSGYATAKKEEEGQQKGRERKK